MSYVVSIRRDIPITAAELRGAIVDDPEFACTADAVEHDGVLTLAWRADADAHPEYFMFTGGAVDVTTPSDDALRKMQSLAEKLGAQVRGEEGEDLTDAQVTAVPQGGGGPVTWTVLLFGALLAGYWSLS